MKKRIFTTTALVCCLMVCFAIADLAGKWTGTLKTPDGQEFPLTYTLKTDSGKLSGSVSSPQGEVPISNGKLIDANNFTFTLSVNGTDITNTGKYYPAADSIGMDIDFNGTKMHTTLKRSN